MENMSPCKKLRCRDCKYAEVDKFASEANWTAYQCGNPSSVYHLSLLNVTIRGDMQREITWRGCEEGERREENAKKSEKPTQADKSADR